MTTNFSDLLDQRRSLILYEDLIRCFGLEPHAILTKVYNWQTWNENERKRAYKRHGVYWMPFKGRTVAEDEKFGIDFIKGAAQKVRKLINLGIVSEHLEPGKSGGRQHRWVRINIPAFNRFITLWIEKGKPNSQSSKKTEKDKYIELLALWDDIKIKYVVIYHGHGVEDEDDSEPDPKKEHNKLVADYIKAWLDCQLSEPMFRSSPYSNKTVRADMSFLIEQGITQQNIQDYVTQMAKPTFFVSLAVIKNNIQGFIKSRSSNAIGTQNAGIEIVQDEPETVNLDRAKQMNEVMENFS